MLLMLLLVCSMFEWSVVENVRRRKGSVGVVSVVKVMLLVLEFGFRMLLFMEVEFW